MFRTTAITMILTELTGVIAVLIDGIIASRGLGIDAFSGISLLKPFSSMVLMIAGFFSTGCSIVCSRLVGAGRKEEANEAFNLSSFLTLAAAAILILLCLCIPSMLNSEQRKNGTRVLLARSAIFSRRVFRPLRKKKPERTKNIASIISPRWSSTNFPADGATR